MKKQAARRDPVPLPLSQDPALYRVAYDQALRALDEQRDELNGIRTRAVTYMAFVGTASAFLVGTSLKGAAPSPGFYVICAVATGLLFWAIAELALLVLPRKVFVFRLDPAVILARWIDRDIPTPTEAELLHGLSDRIGQYIDSNEESLAPVRRGYFRFLMGASLSLTIWIASLWIFGRVGV